MKLLSNSLAFTTVLLLAAGTVNHLSAQAVTPIKFPRVVRTYEGTVAQTSTAGAVTTGTFSLRVQEQGVMYATTVIGGTTAVYSGVVARPSLGEARTNGSGFVQFLPPPVSATTVTLTTLGGQGATFNSTELAPGSILLITSQYPKIPVVITSTDASGGILNADGSSLVFRGDRSTTKGD